MPDPTCRWCHGTGTVQLLTGAAPCECVGAADRPVGVGLLGDGERAELERLRAERPGWRRLGDELPTTAHEGDALFLVYLANTDSKWRYVVARYSPRCWEDADHDFTTDPDDLWMPVVAVPQPEADRA